ncbi:FAD binding domain-containing protein [Oceanirhabdus sp. W0125-5]|uniref:FAD binding domain-containing protein n=1 Tax=Oceanirhabdus sp. W0125-5 TaxID=2999116 RepID=UPI0022F346F1|nr:FAD binding domain-containing protein [Oceanirhabdus sp. W0125-5]WBW95087.1 FAD binding domain-containing protein [Oceanirhabdus sp. W0125-5]
MKALKYIKPLNSAEAMALNKIENSLIIGGGTFIKLSKKEYSVIIDCEKLNLSYIKEDEKNLFIGAYTTLRKLETNKLIKDMFGGILNKSCSKICGIQIRNMATVGGTIGGRYGFSDLIPALMLLNTTVKFLNDESISLEEYLKNKKDDRIIKELVILKENGSGIFKCIKRTALDFSIINMGLLKVAGKLRVSFGARPGIALRCPTVEEYLNKQTLIDFEKVKEYLQKDISFGSDLKASKEYREEVSIALLKESLEEVQQY